MHNPLAAALDSIALGPDVVVDNLTMIPLVNQNSEPSEPLEPRYLVLDDALASGFVEITEVSEQGSVPNLKLVNRGPQPVLIVDGEELLGAKQNRVVNLTILVAAKSELTIPVSCVEAGRWRSRSKAFTSAPRTQYATGRAKRMSAVSYSLAARGDRVSDQADVWEDIAQKSSRLNADSPTSAMDAIFSTHAASLDSFVSGCQPVDGQVGVLFAVGDSIVGFDLFDRPSTLRKVLPKLVRSVAVDAIDDALAPSHHSRGFRLQADGSAGGASQARQSAATMVRAAARQFISVVAESPQHTTAALGLGDDVRLTAPHIAGAALVLGHHVVHLGAFAV